MLFITNLTAKYNLNVSYLSYKFKYDLLYLGVYVSMFKKKIKKKVILHFIHSFSFIYWKRQIIQS